MFSRIKYIGGENGSLVSYRTFQLKDGRNARVVINGDEYSIIALEDNQVLAKGKSKNYIVVRRNAKRDLSKLLSNDIFNREIRQKRK